ncbi:unnamed protein product [Caenorhabditis auriculariae]|uniref:Lipid-binding serum glycoprotein C-terminal domain-containing protein n=1 Tax=Caenorhabditis auriculariae TaxID=2777116 RepID=A0A8S1HE91_9PELO|nr:unnamed protein product [Caenorhabditis auriculariae]
MRPKLKLLLFVFSVLQTASCQKSERDYSPLLDQNTSPSNPGIYLRLMPTGLAYMREIGMKVVNDEILKLQLPTIREQIENGEVAITNAYISKYWAPQEYSLDLIEPSMFSWSMSKMHIRAAGDFQASLHTPLLLPTVPITGHFEALLGHVALTMTVHMSRGPNGAPQVRSALCQSSIGYVDLNVRNTGVITDFFINAFKAFLIAHFKPQVEQRMCKMIENIVDRDMNMLLSTMPLKVRINEQSIDIIGETFGLSPKSTSQPRSKLGQKGLKNFTLVHFVQNLRDQDLVLDYQLMSNPFIQSGAVAMMAKGEISWRGLGGTPFHAPNIVVPPPHGVHMVEFYASDYLANSMLYHAYRQKFLDVIVGPESSPQLKDLLLTSCGAAGFCIGEFLGTLGEQYPDRQVEVVFTARKAPLIVFIENRARFRLHGRMNMFVRPGNATQVKQMVIRSDTTMTANVNLWINNTLIVGNATIENLDFKLLETKIEDVDQASFGDLGLFGAEFLEKLLTEILQMGIAMPTMQGVILKSPKLSFHERFMRVQTYFKLDEQYAGSIVRGAVRQSLSRPYFQG